MARAESESLKLSQFGPRSSKRLLIPMLQFCGNLLRRGFGIHF
jgi:hypothetical protein